MKIAFNPSTVAALTTPPNNKDITFDLRGRNIFARGVKFYGTDTNTWRDIKINNVSIGSHTLDLQNGSNTTLTNTNGIVTINSTWRPVVDNLTSDSTTSSLSAKQGKVLKALIDGKSNSDHNHDGRYVRYYAVTTLDCNNLAAGLTAARISATNAAHTNHSAYLYISDVETPFQIQIPDSSIPYIYKRYYGSGKWSGWFKLNAGYADSAGSVAWANVTGKPSSYTPSAHTHAWNSLTHSSTTENQAILTNGKANGWKLQTLNIARWDNAANNAHSHANKSVLDGITSALVNSWNTAYNFVSNITGTDTDKVINKWEEIVNFLAGITEDNKLNTLLNSKLSVYELADNTNVGTIKNNGIYYSTTDASSGTLINSPFNTGFAFINMTSYDGGDDLRRSRLAFNAFGEIKVSDDRDQANTAETWYNVLTSKNSGINGSTIKLNGTSITVYSSGTADGRYVKKSGDTMSGVLTIDTPNFGALTIKRNDDANGASIQFRGKSSVYGYIGLNNSTKDKQFLRWSSDTSRIYTILDTSSTYISNGKGVINGTTITQVDNATNSTNSTNARKLVNWYSARPTSLNAQFGDGSLRIFYATSSTTEGKPAEDSHILHLAWDNTGGFDAQLAVHARSGKVSTRAQNGGTWQPWKTLAFITDIPSSLKNPYSFNVFGVVYDGSAAKTVTTSNFISQVNEGTSTITDGTMLITSYASNSGFADTNAVNVPYKRKAIHLWEYIKAKTDSLYATKGHNHDGRYVRAFGTSDDNIDSDWGQSFKTFDPIPLGTPPEKNPNISLLSIGENFNKRKQLAFIWNNDNIYYRRHTDSGFTNWRRLAFANEIPTSLKNPYALTISLNGTSQGPYDGSAAKNINITPGSIGAAVSNHSHDYLVVNSADDKSFNSAYHNFQVLYAGEGNGITGKPANVDAFGLFKFRAASGWSGQMLLANGGSLYIRSSEDAKMTNTLAWKTILDSSNYSGILDSRYYTESEVNSLLDAKLNRQNLSYGTWNPRGYHLAADYHYNGGDLSISESGGKIHVSVNGYFWQDEGQYRVLDTSDVAGLKSNLTVHQYLGATDAAWYPLIWGGASHNNTSDSTGAVYKSYDKLSWQTSSQTLYATNIQTNNIKNLSIGGGIYWNPNVESATDGSDAASITLVRSGVAGGTTLVLSQRNDTNDTIQFKTNTAARLYHNSYPILTTQNTYVSNNKGYINGLEITQVNNSDTVDGWHKDEINRTLYITSETSGLSSYWAKLWEINLNNQYNDVTITFLAAASYYPSYFSIFSVYLRQNGSGTSKNISARLIELIGNIAIGDTDLRLYVNNTTGNCQLWGNVKGRYGTMNLSVLKKAWRTATDSSNIGTFFSTSFNSVQPLPGDGWSKIGVTQLLSTGIFPPSAHTHPYLPLSGGTLTGALTIDFNHLGGGTTYSLLNVLFNGTHDYGIVAKFHSYGNDSPAIRFSHSSNKSEYNSQVNTNWSVGMRADTYNDFAITQDRGTSGWGTVRFAINNIGNVGIGINSASYKLHVVGDIYTTTGFKKNGSSDSYVLLGGGGHKAISDFAISTHTHGLLHSDLTVTLANTTTDSGWSMINSSYNGFLLKSIRTQGSAPNWIENNYAAGICFGGADTKGVVSVAYDRPYIKFAGGDGSKPVWWIRLSGISGATYNLANFNADTLDGYHAASFVKMYTGKFTQYNAGTWTKILQFTIPSGHLDPTISFIWHPTECARDVWADFNINIRSGSPIFYVNWKGTTRRTVYCVGDGTTYSVWVQGTKSQWDPYGLVQVISTCSINTYQAGSLQYSDSEPTGTYKVVASMSGIIMYADRLLTARKINGTSFNGTSDITTAYWGTTRTISLTGAITGSVSTNGGGNITINTTYGTENITNLDNRYVKKAGDTMQGNLTFTSGKQTRWTAHGLSYITDGNADFGTSLGGELANLVISSWYGVSFTTSCSGQTYTNKTAVGINCRTGIVYAADFVGPLQGNAATATELQTPRTIWGQSFDGTRDVSGTLSGVANIQFSADGAYDIGSNSATSRYIYTQWLGAKSGSKLELGANNSEFGQGLCIDTNLNVGIGTNSPTQKLDVIGNIRATGQLYLPTTGNYNAILMGDDCWMGDCNISNVIGLSGTNNANSGGIKFGKGGMYIGYNGSSHYSSGTSLWTNFNADTVDGEHASNFSYTHQTSFDFSKIKSGRIVTFDQSNTDYGWINGFASTYDNYLTSVIFNTHRTPNWYVGYMAGIMSTGKTNGLQAVHKLAFADGDEGYPIFLGYLQLYNGDDGTIYSSFPCLGYSVPFTYTRGGSYCLINIPDTSFLTLYIKAAIASVHYSGTGMGHLVGNHRGDGAWWLHCDAVGNNAVQVKGFHLANEYNDSWWGGNPLYSGSGAAKIITVCLFGHVKFR